MLVPVFALWMLDQEFAKAFFLMLILGISDALDGFFAKTFHYKSRLGAWMDPLADKAVLITALVLAYHFGFLPLWFLVLIILRDALTIIGLTVFRYRDANKEFAPHWTGKISTFLQFFLILIILASQMPQLPATPAWTVMGIIALVTITSLFSFAVHVNKWLSSWSGKENGKRQYHS